MTPEHQQLAVLVYVQAMKKQIEEEFESKYSKRINYLVGANNELAHDLKTCEEQCTKLARITDNIVLDDGGGSRGKIYSDGRGGIYQQQQS